MVPAPPPPAPSSNLERAFDDAMMQIYLVAKSHAGYAATRFLQMLGEHGGVETARRLLPHMSEGLTQLWQRNRLDLTVEFLILQPRCTTCSPTRSAMSPVVASSNVARKCRRTPSLSSCE